MSGLDSNIGCAATSAQHRHVLQRHLPRPHRLGQRRRHLHRGAHRGMLFRELHRRTRRLRHPRRHRPAPRHARIRRRARRFLDAAQRLPVATGPARRWTDRGSPGAGPPPSPEHVPRRTCVRYYTVVSNFCVFFCGLTILATRQRRLSPAPYVTPDRRAVGRTPRTQCFGLTVHRHEARLARQGRAYPSRTWPSHPSRGATTDKASIGRPLPTRRHVVVRLEWVNDGWATGWQRDRSIDE